MNSALLIFPFTMMCRWTLHTKILAEKSNVEVLVVVVVVVVVGAVVVVVVVATMLVVAYS